MDNTAEIWKEIRGLQEWIDSNQRYNSIEHPEPLNDLFISHKLKKRLYGDVIVVCTDHYHWETIVEYNKDIRQFKKIIADIFRDHHRVVQQYINHLEKVEQCRERVKKLLMTLWPEYCTEYKDKQVFDTFQCNNNNRNFYQFQKQMDIQGVYFLWGCSGLDYIGQSINIKNRLAGNHHVFRRGEHIIGIIPTSQDQERWYIEAQMINACCPTQNMRRNNPARFEFGESG